MALQKPSIEHFKVPRAIPLLVISYALLATARSGPISLGDAVALSPLQSYHYDHNQLHRQQQNGRMYAIDRTNEHPIPLMPGLLDETLLNRGAFSFGARQVNFDKLKILGNVYVNNVNGRPLRESYLFKSKLAPQMQRNQTHNAPFHHQPTHQNSSQQQQQQQRPGESLGSRSWQKRQHVADQIGHDEVPPTRRAKNELKLQIIADK